jgi:glycosyltransferase involved in cell wall biosynthesis
MLTVVIAALNEVESIGETVHRIRQTLEAGKIEHEIIVVNDGSTDGTGPLARQLGTRVIDHPVPGGYGLALKAGILKAKYDLIAITDADGTYPCHRIEELYRFVAEGGYDMAVGARTGKEYRGTFLKMPARRVFLWMSEYATGRKIDDINSGLRVFRKEIVLRYMGTISNGFSFTTTVTLAAMLNGYFTKYVPIPYFKRVGKSNVRYVRDTLRSLQIIVESIVYYNPLKMFLLVSSFLVALGLLSTAATAFCWKTTPIAVSLAFLASLSFVGSVLVGALGLIAVLVRRIGDRDAELRWRNGQRSDPLGRRGHAGDLMSDAPSARLASRVARDEPDEP